MNAGNEGLKVEIKEAKVELVGDHPWGYVDNVLGFLQERGIRPVGGHIAVSKEGQVTKTEVVFEYVSLVAPPPSDG